MNSQIVKIFLRFALASAFLSAVADRFGLWSKHLSSWGNWDTFVDYTSTINPWFAKDWVPYLSMVATGLEVIFAICLIIGFRLKLFAQLSGVLLLLFALAMTFSTGVKGPLDYSVFTASAAAFALSSMGGK